MPHTLLVVDDDPDIRDLLTMTLEGVGYVVLVAKDATEARARVESAHIDLVLIDAVLPGESGPELAEWIAREKKLPLVLLSGDWIAYQELKQHPYVRLSKPFRVTNLLHVIDQEVRAAERRIVRFPESVGGKRPPEHAA